MLPVVILVLLLERTAIAFEYTPELKSHEADDLYNDVSTIFKIPDDNCITDPYTGKTTCNNLIGEVHLRKNAVDMPIEYNGRLLYSGKKALEFIVDVSYSNETFTRNRVDYDTAVWGVIHKFINENTFEYDLVSNTENTIPKIVLKGSLQSQLGYSNNDYPFKISWVQDKNIEGCVAITYRYPNGYNTQFNLEIYDINNDTSIVVHPLEYTDESKTAFIRTNTFFLKNDPYYLKIDNFQHQQIEITRITQCTHSNEEIYEIIIPRAEIKDGSIYVGEGNSENDVSRVIMNEANLISIYRGRYLNTITTMISKNNNNLQYPECEINKYGAGCDEICSTKNTFCKNMIICSRFGCSCASGYTGTRCDQKCDNGYYGRNCLKRCPQNCDLCNIYTGICVGKCKKSYMLPNCTQKYPIIANPPQLISSNYHTITLEINFEGYYENSDEMFYQIIHKDATSENDFQYSEFDEINELNKTITIDNLQSGTIYTFGVILIVNDGNYNEEDLITVNYTTLCHNPSNINYGVVPTSDINTINVTWKKQRSDIPPTECKITKYLLELSYDSNFEEQSKIAEKKFTEKNEHVFKNLISGHAYFFRITAFTVSGSIESSEIQEISTLQDGFISIKNIMVNKTFTTPRSLRLTWNPSNIITTPINYLIKYKVNKYFSCSNNVIDSNWTRIFVYNRNSYDFENLTPNSQYVFKVETVNKNYDYGENENMVYAKTVTTKPQIAPILDINYPVYVTNQSVTIKWLLNKTECIKFNGFHKGFELVLVNKKENEITNKETRDYGAEFINLNPHTDYELMVYTKNNIGINKDYALVVPFKTKSKFLPPVEDLSVYKKNTKTRSASLRWSYSDQYNVDQFIVLLNTNKPNVNVREIAVEPIKCSAWPQMYCTTIDNLIPGTENIVKVKAKSIDYPTGGLPASVNFNTMDGPPDEPSEVRTKLINSENVTLDWDIPWTLNGALNSFVINVEEVSSVDISLCCNSFPAIEVKVTEENPTYNYTINDLRPGSTYAIGVMAKTSWYGQAKRIFVTTLA